MKLTDLVLHDTKANCYLDPWQTPAPLEQVMRTIGHDACDPGNPMFVHAPDFMLCVRGEFDKQTGESTVYNPPRPVASVYALRAEYEKAEREAHARDANQIHEEKK